MLLFAFQTVYDTFAQKWPEIQAFVTQCFLDIQTFWENNLKPCLDAIKAFIENTLAPAFQLVFGTIIKPLVDDVFTHIKNIWEGTLKPVFVGITDFLTGTFTGDWEQAWQGIEGIFSGIVNGIITGAETMVNGAIDVLNGLITGINSLGVVQAIADAFGTNGIPLIERVALPRLEKGGILEKGQVGLLEGKGAEAVVPLDQNRAWIQAVASDMNTAIGGAGAMEVLERILDAIQTMDDSMTEKLMTAFASMKFDVNNREFARMVKAVN